MLSFNQILLNLFNSYFERNFQIFSNLNYVAFGLFSLFVSTRPSLRFFFHLQFNC